jgi:hypothetical protein
VSFGVRGQPGRIVRPKSNCGLDQLASSITASRQQPERITVKKTLVLSLLCLASLLAFASTGSAGDVRAAGTCTAGSSSKIKLGLRDTGIRVEFQVDQDVSGVVWNVTLSDDGVQVFSGQATTADPSGSFELRRKIRDLPGPDTVVGNAVNPATGESCTASATI